MILFKVLALPRNYPLLSLIMNLSFTINLNITLNTCFIFNFPLIPPSPFLLLWFVAFPPLFHPLFPPLPPSLLSLYFYFAFIALLFLPFLSPPITRSTASTPLFPFHSLYSLSPVLVLVFRILFYYYLLSSYLHILLLLFSSFILRQRQKVFVLLSHLDPFPPLLLSLFFFLFSSFPILPPLQK